MVDRASHVCWTLGISDELTLVLPRREIRASALTMVAAEVYRSDIARRVFRHAGSVPPDFERAAV